MKGKLTNNLSLKIFAVLLAAGLWMISININDPYQSKDYSVEVQLQNMNVMTNAGKYVEVAGDTDKISVRVRGNRSVMDNFSSSNIVAVADLSKIEENNQVPIEVSATKGNESKIESIRADRTHITVNIEEIRRIQKNIEVVTKNEPETGYVLGKTTTEQNALRISGPESIVNKVDRAVVSFDLARATEDLSMMLPIELYDKEGNRIIDSRLTASINEVQCVATILSTKEVPLALGTEGVTAKGYGFTGEIESEISTVVIAAKNSILRGITEIKIADAVKIQSAKQSVEAEIDLREYLPEGVILADASFDGKIKATAVIEKKLTQKVEIEAEQVEVVNLPEGIVGEIVDTEESILVELTGFESVLSEYDVKDIHVKADVLSYLNDHNMMEIEPGEYEMELKFDLPEGIWLEEDVEVFINIMEK